MERALLSFMIGTSLAMSIAQIVIASDMLIDGNKSWRTTPQVTTGTHVEIIDPGTGERDWVFVTPDQNGRVNLQKEDGSWIMHVKPSCSYGACK